MTDLVLDTRLFSKHQLASGQADFQTPPPFEVPGETPTGHELVALVEALLLVSPEPTTVEQLATGAGVDSTVIDVALAEIETSNGRGWIIVRHGQTMQLSTAPRFAGHVRRFLGLEREAKLSSAALETLAIIAYEQPVTRAEIEAVRGVDSSGVLSTLINRGLVEIAGRLATVGNPIQYGVTPEFLKHFGLGSLADLPPLGTVDGRDITTALDSAIAAAETPVEVDEHPSAS
ncbi:MAG: SMC-Scp complex subunit ScpB [Thermomicrobiales bacterium]